MYRNWNPPNRFDGVEIDWEEPPPPPDLEILDDHGKSILVRGEGPWPWSINPYRGCTHACAYCYAREYHELLGYGAGSDFERRIVVKRSAAELLRAAFEAPSWRGEPVAFSGVTDAYQPLERRLGLTRSCIEVCAAYRNPVSIVTRSPLVLRDLDLLRELAAVGAAAVTVSIPIGDRALQRLVEPGAPAPSARFEAVRILAEAGVPVGVSVSPILPGLSDHAVPAVLQEAREAGARWAWADLVRLPGNVAEVFERRLREATGDVRAEAVLAKIERMGRRDDPVRLALDGLVALCERRLGYGAMWQPPHPSPFRRPSAQLSLFG